MPKLNVALSPAEGRLISKMRRMVVIVRCHGPPAIDSPAKPRHSTTSDAIMPSTQVVVCAYAEPIGPSLNTSVSRYARTTLSTMLAIERNIGVRVSPAERIADDPHRHTFTA